MNATMNLHQSLPSSCYLNTSENSTVSKSNLKSISPKLQKRKQRLHLGAKKVDPALFLMMEKENEKKVFTNSVTDRPRVDKIKTYSKSVSTEDDEEEEDVSKDALDTQKSLKIQSRSDNRQMAKHNIPVVTHSTSNNDSPAKADDENTLKQHIGVYHQEYKEAEPIKPEFSPCSNDEAQKKFGSAKSISSERYFNDMSGSKYKSDLSRFTNCSSISSDDLFNRTAYEPNLQDLFFSSLDSISYEELAASLKNGVAKVAGKLGSALKSFASRLPHEFGEY
ncbi:unnamed protein product [Nezara viridula]|uniref:Uncharacterized protein n=1 Tax=Nezara viridula TaxID=85310 RepID=A0A9P0E7Z2_NEZVI|nr:unnamed protein product [Nezara viridula]